MQYLQINTRVVRLKAVHVGRRHLAMSARLLLEFGPKLQRKVVAVNVQDDKHVSAENLQFNAAFKEST